MDQVSRPFQLALLATMPPSSAHWRRGRAVVLLFYGWGSDDHGVRSELARVNRRGGRVVVLSAPISRVAGFGAITQGVRVLQAPTVVVVGPSRQARALPGYTDHTEVDQAAQSALRGH